MRECLGGSVWCRHLSRCTGLVRQRVPGSEGAQVLSLPCRACVAQVAVIHDEVLLLVWYLPSSGQYLCGMIEGYGFESTRTRSASSSQWRRYLSCLAATRSGSDRYQQQAKAPDDRHSCPVVRRLFFVANVFVLQAPGSDIDADQESPAHLGPHLVSCHHHLPILWCRMWCGCRA